MNWPFDFLDSHGYQLLWVESLCWFSLRVRPLWASSSAGLFLSLQQSRHDDEQAEEAAEFAQEHKHIRVLREFRGIFSVMFSLVSSFYIYSFFVLSLCSFCSYSCFCVFLLSGVLYLPLWSVGFVCLCAHFTLTFWMLYLFLGNFGRPWVGTPFQLSINNNDYANQYWTWRWTGACPEGSVKYDWFLLMPCSRNAFGLEYC